MGAPAGCSGPVEKTRHPPLGAALGVQLGARALTVLLPRGNCASNGPIALITPVLSLVFLSKEGLPRAFQNTWGHCDLEKGTEGAQVYGLLGKELGQEPSSSPLCGLWDDMDSQHGTCLSGIREML